MKMEQAISRTSAATYMRWRLIFQVSQNFPDIPGHLDGVHDGPLPIVGEDVPENDGKVLSGVKVSVVEPDSLVRLWCYEF